MPKNDVSAFANNSSSESQKILQEGKSPKSLEEKRGRKKKPIEEKEDAVLNIKLTQKEKAILAKKAGLVPIATYLKAFLRDKTDLLK